MYQLGTDQCPLACEFQTCVRVEDGPVTGVQRRALEVVRGHIICGERLEELEGLCSLEKRRFKGHHTVVHKGSFLLGLVVTKHRAVLLN